MMLTSNQKDDQWQERQKTHSKNKNKKSKKRRRTRKEGGNGKVMENKEEPWMCSPWRHINHKKISWVSYTHRYIYSVQPQNWARACWRNSSCALCLNVAMDETPRHGSTAEPSIEYHVYIIPYRRAPKRIKCEQFDIKNTFSQPKDRSLFRCIEYLLL